MALAIAAVRDLNEELVVVDLDPQLTCFNHIQGLKDKLGMKPTTKMPTTLHGLTFVDTPGNDLPLTTRAAKRSQLVVIPTQPSRFDLRGSVATIEMVRDLHRPACWLPTRVRPRANAHVHIATTLEHMNERRGLKWPILPPLGDRVTIHDYLEGKPPDPRNPQFWQEASQCWQALKALIMEVQP